MKTYPYYDDRGNLDSFEILQTWIWIGTILRILRSVPGVTNVRRVRGDDRRVLFDLKGEPGVVLEPFGDNSRYLIAIEQPSSARPDLAPVHEAFLKYRWWMAEVFRR